MPIQAPGLSLCAMAAPTYIRPMLVGREFQKSEVNGTRGFDAIDGCAFLVILVTGALIDIANRLVPADLPPIAPFTFNAPIFLGCALFAYWYGRGLICSARKDRPAVWRMVAYFTGIALIYGATETRFEYLAQHMFFLNRLQQVALGIFAPFLLAFSWPLESLTRGVPANLQAAARHPFIAKPLRIVAHPAAAAVIMIITTDVWLIPAVDFASMLDPLLYDLMNLSMILAGLLFWFAVIDPRPCPPCRHTYLTRMAAGFLSMFPQIAVAATIALSTTDFYDFYALCGRLYPSISPQYDQMLGGIIQWIPPGMLNTAVLFILLRAIHANEEKAAKQMIIPAGSTVIEAKWTGR